MIDEYVDPVREFSEYERDTHCQNSLNNRSKVTRDDGKPGMENVYATAQLRLSGTKRRVPKNIRVSQSFNLTQKNSKSYLCTEREGETVNPIKSECSKMSQIE